jgi:hypothetical protein
VSPAPVWEDGDHQPGIAAKRRKGRSPWREGKMPVMNTESIFPSGRSAAFGCGLTGPLGERAKIQVGHLYRSAHFRDLSACPRLLGSSRLVFRFFSWAFLRGKNPKRLVAPSVQTQNRDRIKLYIDRKPPSLRLAVWQGKAGIYCHSVKVTVNLPPIDGSRYNPISFKNASAIS